MAVDWYVCLTGYFVFKKRTYFGYKPTTILSDTIINFHIIPNSGLFLNVRFCSSVTTFLHLFNKIKRCNLDFHQHHTFHLHRKRVFVFFIITCTVIIGLVWSTATLGSFAISRERGIEFERESSHIRPYIFVPFCSEILKTTFKTLPI